MKLVSPKCKYCTTSFSKVQILHFGGKIQHSALELQYKGNYLLLATIDGRNMKYIIRKGTQEHDDIAKIGLAGMTEEKKKELISLYLLPKIDSDKVAVES